MLSLKNTKKTEVILFCAIAVVLPSWVPEPTLVIPQAHCGAYLP